MTRQPSIVALCLAAALAAAPARAARTDWRELTVGHFHLYSTLSDSSTRNVARQLQVFEQTVGRLLQSDDRLPDVPTMIYILDRPDFMKYAGARPGVGGFFSERPFANYLVVNGEQQFDDVKVTVFHEYTHFIQRNTRSMQLPRWYTEGYAELFSSFRIDKENVVVGEAPAGIRLSLEPRDWIPMERLLAVKESDPEYRTEQLMPQFYGEAWVLVHLLLFDNNSLLKPTGQYLGNMDLGYPEADAFAHSFPFDKAGLDAAVHALIKRRVIDVKRLTFRQPAAVDDAPITRLSAAQADAQLARLVLMLGQPKEVAEPLLAAALKESPRDVELTALAARAAASFKQSSSAADLATSLGAGASDARARIDVAAALLTTDETPQAAQRVLDLLGGVVHGDAPDIEAVHLWATAAMITDVDPKLFVAVLAPAAARVPHDTQILQGLAAASVALGDKVQARAYYNRIILVSSYPKERAWAQKIADSAALQDEAPSVTRK